MEYTIQGIVNHEHTGSLSLVQQAHAGVGGRMSIDGVTEEGLDITITFRYMTDWHAMVAFLEAVGYEIEIHKFLGMHSTENRVVDYRRAEILGYQPACEPGGVNE